MKKSFVTVLTLLACAIAPAALAVDEMAGSIRIEDEEGNPLYAADPDGSEVTFVYGEDGQCVATIDQDGVVTDMTQPGWTGDGE